MARYLPLIPHESHGETGFVSQTTGDIRALNTGRGLAALMIALLHGPAAFGVAELVPHANLGVDLFFVLSGFVIAYAYGPRIDGGMGFPRFAQLRLARLYPLIVLATLVGFALWAARAVMHHAVPGLDALLALPLNLILCPAASDASPDGLAFPFLLQAWSITWEVVMYLSFFVWRRHMGRGAWMVSVVGAITLWILAATHGRLDGGWTTQTFLIGGARAVFGFWTGVAISRLRRPQGGVSLDPLADRALMTAAAIAAGLMLVYVIFESPTLWWADALGVTVGVPLVLAALVLRPQTWLETWLGDRLGEASYSLYMLHLLTLDLLASLLRHIPPLAPAAHMAVGFGWLACVVAISWCVWRWVETPLRIYFSRSITGHPGGGRGPVPMAVSPPSVP